MAIDLRILGSKLQQFREQLQESFEEVSRGTGIAIERLTAIEQGSVRPTADEILILADHWACDFEIFLSDDISAAFKDTDVLYRRHGDAFSKKDRRAVQDFLYLCETEAFLMRELDRPIRDDFSFSPKGTFYKAQGEDGALALRKFFDYERPGRPLAPRDIYDDFRKLGVHVFRRKLENSNISGLFLSHAAAGPCLLVNYSEDVYRQRFTAAHEMAHSIFDAEDQAVVSFVNDNKKLKEIRANRFASCYLMPPSMLRRLSPDPSQWTQAVALEWANKFRVSCDALGIALKEAGRADEATSRRIRSYRVPISDKIDPELGGDLSPAARRKKQSLLERGLSDNYAKLCFDAFYQELISIGRLAEALLADETELREVAQLYRASLRYGD